MELAELETIGPVEFGRRPASGQATLFDESEVERETKPHEGKRPGEFAPKPKRPQTSGGQMLLVDSGVGDHPVERKPVQSAMPPEVTGPVQPAPIKGQKELFQAKFVPHPVHRDYPDEFETVHADAGKLDREWAKEPASYLPSNGRGQSEVDGRRDNFKAFLGTGKAIEQPHVVANDSGQLGFNDGRHRARVLMDMGHKTIPLSVPVEDAARIRSLVGVDQEFSRDLESIGPVEFSSWDESKHHRESETHDGKKPGEFAPEGGNGHELAEEDAARTQRAQQAAATKPPETFASDAPLPKPYQFWEQAPLSEVLGGIPQRPAWLRKRDQVAKMPWTEAHDSAQHSAAKYDVNIDDVVATMPAAHAHMLSGMIEREDAKKDARKITGLTARHEYADSDWSNIPRFDETAREFAGLHPEIGIRPDDHYAPQLMWDFIREGKLKLPRIDSRETADMAASMLASSRRSGPVHFTNDEDDEREPEEDEWTVVHQGDTSFDPSQFSRESEVEDIAKSLGIDADELLAVISWIDDGVRATIRNRNSTVIGLVVRHGNKIEIRDANSKLAGTITKAGGKSTFRSREGRSMGSVGEFSREGPVEFGRVKPAKGQSVLDFDEPEQKPVKTKHRDGLGRAVNPRTGQVQARKGGEKSEVDGEWYAGGEWMPVHGLTRKSEPREKSLATPDSGTFKPNENQKPKYAEPRVLSPQDLDAAKQKKADQSKWDEIKSGPLGKVKWLGDSPNAKGMHYLTSMNQWHDYAETVGPAEIKRITGELESVWRRKVSEAAAAEKDLPEDSIEYWINTPKQQAEQDIGMYPRANGTHEKRIPGSAYARQLVQHLLDGDSLKSRQRPIDNMHDIHRVMTGTYESEFSRDFGPVEFARHSFSSTQFNIEDAERGRNKDPIAALMKLVKSIPTEHLHEGDHESPDSLHVTCKYGIHTENADEIRSIVEGFGPVTIKLGKVSVFPANEKKSYDVVKVTVFGEDIRRLNKLISESTECTDTFPDYRPHITLALLEPGYGKRYAGNDSVEGMELKFDTLQFSDKDRKKTAVSLTGGESEFSRDDDWVFAPAVDGPVEFARPIRPGAGQQSMGFSDDEQPSDTPWSSNVHSFRLDPNGPGGGSLLVRYLNKEKNGPGPEYRYFTGGRSLYDQMKTDAKKQGTMGGFVWNHLRIRGSIAGHQVPFELAGTGPDKYVPRAAGLKRGHTGEWFNKRTFQGQTSSLAPGPVRKSNGSIPGYDPKKLKLAGEKPAAATPPPASPPTPSQSPATPTTTPTASSSPNPASPPSPPAAPAPKKPSLIDRVLGLFRKKPKDQKPKEFSRDEIRDIETVYAAMFRCREFDAAINVVSEYFSQPGPVEFARKPAAGQRGFIFDEDSVVRETTAHDGKRPGEFANKNYSHSSTAVDNPVDSVDTVSGSEKHNNKDRKMDSFRQEIRESLPQFEPQLNSLTEPEWVAVTAWLGEMKSKTPEWSKKLAKRLEKGAEWIRENGLVPLTFDVGAKLHEAQVLAAKKKDADSAEAERVAIEAKKPKTPKDSRVSLVAPKTSSGDWKYSSHGITHDTEQEAQKRLDNYDNANRETEERRAREKAEKQEAESRAEKMKRDRIGGDIKGQFVRGGDAIQVSEEEYESLGKSDAIGNKYKVDGREIEIEGAGRPFQSRGGVSRYLYLKKDNLSVTQLLEKLGRKAIGEPVPHTVTGLGKYPFKRGDIIPIRDGEMAVVLNSTGSTFQSRDDLDDMDDFDVESGWRSQYEVQPVERTGDDPETKQERKERKANEFRDFLKNAPAIKTHDKLPELWSGGDDDRFLYSKPQEMTGHLGLYFHKGPYPTDPVYFRKNDAGKFEELGGFTKLKSEKTEDQSETQKTKKAFSSITLPDHPSLSKFGQVTAVELQSAYDSLDDFQKDGAKSKTLAGLISKQVQREKGVQCPLSLIPVLNAAIQSQIDRMDK